MLLSKEKLDHQINKKICIILATPTLINEEKYIKCVSSVNREYFKFKYMRKANS